MDPHRFERDGETYEARFERVAEGWVARIRREGDDHVHVLAFPDGAGFDPEDVRGSLVAGCESILAQLPGRGTTRH